MASTLAQGPTPTVLGIRELHRRVTNAIVRELRGPVWVRAEIGELTERNGHCFVTLAEAARDSTEGDAALDVVIWRPMWTRLRRQLDERGLVLHQGLTVTLRGDLRLRDGAGHLQLRCTDLDTDALLGEMAARRLALRRALAAEGLLDANRRQLLALVPLRVGVVASTNSQGYRDFTGVLAASGFRFELLVEAVTVQGVAAAAAVAAAVTTLSRAAVDVIVVVRGGGARADLDAFDHESVSRAVATALVPVWTGLGHTGDQCLADEVAHTSFATPTACAHALVATVAAFADHLSRRAGRLHGLLDRSPAVAEERLRAQRRLLAGCGAAQLHRHGDRATARAAHLRRATTSTLARTSAQLDRSAQLLPQAARAALERADHKVGDSVGQARRSGPQALTARSREVAVQRRLLGALNPVRQFERGWTMTLDSDGRLVRNARQLHPGQLITSRFVDGERSSVVASD